MKNYPYGSSRLFEELSKIVYNKYNVLFFILIIFSFALRFYFRSNYLDDWDSVQFVMGLEEYSIPDHQPHPPGYPLYIFIGRIFYIFIGDSVTTFTLISAIFGTLALIPTFLISKKIFNDRVGLLSAVLLSFTPAQMLFSEVVMTDIVSLFFVTFTAYILYLGISSTRYLYFGALMVGITTGIRMTDVIMFLLLLLVIIHKKDIKETMISGLMVLIGISMWLIPVIIDTGLDTFLKVQRLQWNYASGEASTLSSFGGLSLANIFLTFRVYINLIIDSWSSAILIFILAALVFIFVRVKRPTNINNDVPRIGIVFILFWLLIYVVFSNFFNLLSISRYLLPQFPPLAIFFSYTIIRLIDIQNKKFFKALLSSILFISVLFMCIQGVIDINAINTTIPPPVEAANFIMEHYDQNEVVIVAWESFRHFQYYLPNYDVRLFNLNLTYTSNYKNKTIISDLPITLFESNKKYSFERDHNIYPKHSYVGLYETEFDLLKNTFILQGWHGLDDWDGSPTRWMENNATFMIYSDENRVVDLSLKAVSFYRPRTIEIYVNDLLLMVAEVPPDHFVIERFPGISLTEGANVVRFHVPEGCEKPSDIRELNNPDSRCLSVAVQDIKIHRDILTNDLESSSTSLGWHGL